MYCVVPPFPAPGLATLSFYLNGAPLLLQTDPSAPSGPNGPQFFSFRYTRSYWTAAAPAAASIFQSSLIVLSGRFPDGSSGLRCVFASEETGQEETVVESNATWVSETSVTCPSPSLWPPLRAGLALLTLTNLSLPLAPSAVPKVGAALLFEFDALASGVSQQRFSSLASSALVALGVGLSFTERDAYRCVFTPDCPAPASCSSVRRPSFPRVVLQGRLHTLCSALLSVYLPPSGPCRVVRCAGPMHCMVLCNALYLQTRMGLCNACVLIQCHAMFRAYRRAWCHAIFETNIADSPVQ